MITQADISRIEEATDIVDLIGEYVSLKKDGAGFKGCCPFHNEKTPSFKVNPARQIYKCFGCGKGGAPRYNCLRGARTRALQFSIAH